MGTSRRHLVNFYVRDTDLIDDLAARSAEGLRRGDSWLTVATASHRAQLDAALRAAGVEVEEAVSLGRYVAVDAAEVLQELMLDARPDRERFRSIVGGLVGRLEHAAAAGTQVHAFGEMVALLWQDGNVIAAMELEDLWNELMADHAFSLYCAYPVDLVASEGLLADVSRVCEQHSELIVQAAPPEVGPGEPPPDRAEAASEATTAVRIFFPVPQAIREVREFIRSAGGASLRSDAVEDACLVASELATNALRHVGSPFTIALRLADSSLRVSVRDLSSARPAPRSVSIRSTTGRGLSIVEELSESWGVEELSDGKVVWAELSA
jgi:anti-sigma regulatory factor (Ser/Thr protein kinase)